MLDMIIGIALGMAVCLFGLWCYIKGQGNAILLLQDKQPQQVKTPVQVISEGAQAVGEKIEEKKEEKAEKSLSEQVAEMCRYRGE